MAVPVAVQVRGLVRRLGGAAVLDGLDLDIADGAMVALLGRSGSGKTTLLRCLAGLDPVQAGTMTLPQALCMVFQEPRLLPWRPVWHNVALGLPGAGGRQRAAAALAEVGLSALAHSWPRTLSGGEAQRVGLARALVRRPALLLLDEPFAALDALTRLQLQDLLAGIWMQQRMAMLLVTHDVDEALRLADRVLLLQGGRIAQEWTVAASRPRRRADPGLGALRLQLLAALGIPEPVF